MMSNEIDQPARSPDASSVASADLPTRTRAAALGVEMRGPLARIALANGLLAREALSPAARFQTEQIFDAIEELDALIERNLRIQLPELDSHGNERSCASVLRDVRARFGPALAACDIQWVEPRDDTCDRRCDAERLRIQMSELLGFTLQACEGGGRIETRLDAASDDTTCVRLSLARNVPANGAALRSLATARDELAGRMREQGARLETTLSPRTFEIHLFLRANDGDPAVRAAMESACPAS